MIDTELNLMTLEIIRSFCHQLFTLSIDTTAKLCMMPDG